MNNINYKHPSSISLFNLYDSLSFKYVKGKTVKELIDEKNSFFEWALINTNFFCFDDFTVKYIDEKGFHLSDKAIQNQKIKREKYAKDTIEYNEKYEPITEINVDEETIKLYKLDYKVGFGIYSDKTIEELIEISPSRIEFFIQSIDWFGLTLTGIDKLISNEKNFVYLKSTFDLLKLKYELAPEFMKGIKKRSSRDGDTDYYENDGDYKSDYEGSYAHDVEGFSDDDINDAFDGDPEAYWNID